MEYRDSDGAKKGAKNFHHALSKIKLKLIVFHQIFPMMNLQKKKEK
jgi:hypothetical protein